MNRKGYKRIRLILVILAAFIAIILLLDNVATTIYPVKYPGIIKKYSQEYGIDPMLVLAVIKVESNFRPQAVSPKNARGLMQITEKTGKWGAQQLDISNYDIDLLFDPETNIRIGCWYLSVLYDEFGETDLVLAAYNAGSGNVTQWLADSRLSQSGTKLDKIPFKETDYFLRKVHTCLKMYKRLYENKF